MFSEPVSERSATRESSVLLASYKALLCDRKADTDRGSALALWITQRRAVERVLTAQSPNARFLR